MPYTYILETAKKSYYIGSTNDLEKRLHEHEGGRVKSTKDKLPITLVFKEYFKTAAEAKKKEYKIKRWKSKKMVQLLITMGPSSSG